MTTPAKALPSMSLKPKSATESGRASSSNIVMVLLVPAGASFTGVTVIDTAPLVKVWPSPSE